MKASPEPRPDRSSSFRVKLMAAMMLVVSALTAVGLYFAQRNVAAETEYDQRVEFQGALAALHGAQEVRSAALAQRCRGLANSVRIRAALAESDVRDLYENAAIELRDVLESGTRGAGNAQSAVHASFYRFTNADGAVLSPPRADGTVKPAAWEAQLALPGVPDEQQLGYAVVNTDDRREEVAEIIATPIVAMDIDTREPVAVGTLVLGFDPIELIAQRPKGAIDSGIWLNGRLHLPSLTEPVRTGLAWEVARALAEPGRAGNSFRVQVAGVPHSLFFKRLNPGSLYPPAYEVCIYPLADLLARQRLLRWQVVAAGVLLLAGGIVASHVIAARLARPVEKLAHDSEENRTQRERAEAALEVTSEELQRSARFAADASHQLKTPVTVLRAGLEELLARDDLSTEMREELAALVHQTFRLTGMVEDLLLLSRMDAGRLEIDFQAVNLTHLVEGWLDDFGALPDPHDLRIESDVSPALHIVGEKRYVTLILQNLLENARKYNQRHGRIRLTARESEGWVLLQIANTARPVPRVAQEHVFDRFHRGGVGENVPGHGLGLNLARELARLHGGDVRLVRSDEEWTEFEVRFRPAKAVSATALQVA
jgi:signal transduction histidine kinase